MWCRFCSVSHVFIVHAHTYNTCINVCVHVFMYKRMCRLEKAGKQNVAHIGVEKVTRLFDHVDKKTSDDSFL